MIRLKTIRTKEDLIGIVSELGFLPFFTNEVPGFSIEENVASSAWYGGDWEGRINWPVWEWKGELAADRVLVYGKFFRGRAGFVSPEWFPDLSNYRRDGYDFDARFDDGLAPRKDKEIVDYLAKNGPTLSKGLKAALGYGKGGQTGFETVITRLQMQCYVEPVNFEYQKAKDGKEYGWGVARYGLSDQWYDGLGREAYERAPKESFERILAQLEKKLPGADPKELKKLLK